MIVRRLTQHPEIYLYEMVRDEFGIDPREAENSDLLRAPLAMSGSYAIGSLVPILAFMLPLPVLGSTLVLAALCTRRALCASDTLPERSANAIRSAKASRSRCTAAPSSRSRISSAILFRRSSATHRFPLAASLAHALAAGILQAATFFWDSLFGLIFGFLDLRDRPSDVDAGYAGALPGPRAARIALRCGLRRDFVILFVRGGRRGARILSQRGRHPLRLCVPHLVDKYEPRDSDSLLVAAGVAVRLRGVLRRRHHHRRRDAGPIAALRQRAARAAPA